MKANWKYILSWLLLMILGFYLINTLIMVGIIDNFIENMLVMIGINIILATGLNLIIGFSGQFSLGHAGFMAIGAYVTAIITQSWANEAGFIVSMIIGIVISGIIALIVGLATFVRLKGDYLAIATLGVAEIIRNIINNLKITGGSAGMFNIPQLCSWPTVYIMVCLTTIVILNFIRSRDGRAIKAVREDELAAEAMGINTTKWKVVAFVLGAAVAAIAGSLQASYLQTISPTNFGIMESISILVIVVLGGIGSITGTFLAAAVLGILDTVLQNFGSLRMVIYAIALIMIMLFKPSGLLGNWELSLKNLTQHFVKKERE
jgi:branched-chain amino acid transport system permease protein